MSGKDCQEPHCPWFITIDTTLASSGPLEKPRGKVVSTEETSGLHNELRRATRPTIDAVLKWRPLVPSSGSHWLPSSVLLPERS